MMLFGSRLTFFRREAVLIALGLTIGTAAICTLAPPREATCTAERLHREQDRPSEMHVGAMQAREARPTRQAAGMRAVAQLELTQSLSSDEHLRGRLPLGLPDGTKNYYYV